MKEQKTRYHLLDTIRGLALVSMILYHLCWDAEYVLGIRLGWYHGSGAYVWQQITCWSFIFLSGFCWSLGKKPLKRGLMVLAGAFAVALVTWIMMPEQAAYFGILTLLGSAMILLIPLSKWLRKCPAQLGTVLFFLLFILSRNVNKGYLGFECWNLLALPSQLYRSWFATFLGFTEKGFYSVDYFSLLPWFFLYGSGYFLYRCLQEKKELKAGSRLTEIFNWKIGPLVFLGRHSLWIYLLHQPILYGFLMIAAETHFFES